MLVHLSYRYYGEEKAITFASFGFLANDKLIQKYHMHGTPPSVIRHMLLLQFFSN
jgi:hypothetical protein